MNSEGGSFHSNPYSSSFISTITSNIYIRHTAAIAIAAAYTKKFLSNVQSVGIWERKFEY